MNDHIECNGHTFRVRRNERSGLLDLFYRGDRGWESLSSWRTYDEAREAMRCFVPKLT